MTKNFEGQYIDKSTGNTYEIIANEKQGSGVIGLTFITSTGMSVSAITLEDGSQGMMLEDGTNLSRI
ncbi:hypothetical protein QF117_02595 [Vibrio sp. YMD68]|uniref:hypothetical protein n=1 Tax=Vibrio sp. YMD68 TaxID=3042300 RepID=UPI00249C1759|nr:hypothetical protein [Vibrio sp. YMD68]WGV98869.1 hypothetical protein QF117_02595 [Vibrio sp. YMD68]